MHLGTDSNAISNSVCTVHVEDLTIKQNLKTEIYINRFIEHFPRIPIEHRIMPLKSLHAVICMMGEISPQIFNTIKLQGNVFNHLILSILYETMDKSSKQKPAAESLDSDVLEKLCDALMPFTNPNYSTEVSRLTYCLFADLHKFVPEHINTCGVTSVPERVLHAVDIGPDDAIKEKLHKLDTNLRNPQISSTKDNQQDIISKEDSDTAKTSVQESSEYIEDHLPEDTSHILKKIVKEVLYSLNALHGHDTKVLHRRNPSRNPINSLVYITGKARLADFGISRRLKLGETTCRTNLAGKYWKARETLEEDINSGYKRSSDIQPTPQLHQPFWL
ncbi:hypothetical protein Q7C36_004706 [Tachysurus vachellii]|uniref:Protein kinase domain-containing protein n=1 Tax=Tachysurus vachellii TaxID=175792 RepID=A0AA88NIZ5_TACVA|nr:hypothetical protein Q7C36_004706 [Tachysurus vachellii]